MTCVRCPLSGEKICDNLCPMGFEGKNVCDKCPRLCSVQNMNEAHVPSPNKRV